MREFKRGEKEREERREGKREERGYYTFRAVQLH